MARAAISAIRAFHSQVAGGSLEALRASKQIGKSFNCDARHRRHLGEDSMEGMFSTDRDWER
jgi:hypothetical protein